MYAQMLVGMVAFTGQWWLDTREPARDDIVAHVVNLAWNGLSRLDAEPTPGDPGTPGTTSGVSTSR
jgi:hypothetical protein